MLVGLTLLIMGVITIFSMLFGNALTGYTFDNVIDTEATVNGTTSTWSASYSGEWFSVDPIVGATTMIITIAVIGVALGLTVFGSGLSESAQKIIMYGAFYTGIWTIFSLLSYPLISAIEVFGVLIYTVLTLLFGIGVVQRYFEHD